MRTEQDRRRQYQQNRDTVAFHLRTCRMAARLLADLKPQHHWWYIWHCTEHSRAELLPLKAALLSSAFLRARFHSYDRGLVSRVFDVHEWRLECWELQKQKARYKGDACTPTS